MMVVSVGPGLSLDAQAREVLFDAPEFLVEPYDITGDGRRFRMPKPVSATHPPQVNVTRNWHAELLDRVPTP